MPITKVTNRVLDSNAVGVAQLSAGAVATKLGSDSGQFGFRNKIINGDMRISQRRGTGLYTAAANGFRSFYTLDRWLVELSNGTGGVNLSQDFNVVPSQQFYNSLRVDVTSTTSQASPQYLLIDQIIEGCDVRDIMNRPFTLSFWVRSNKTGIYCIALQNAGPGNISDRSYITEYTIQTPDVWEYKTITFPGLDTTGGWNWENGRGLEVIFVLSKDSSTGQPLNQWVSGNIAVSPNQVNLLDSTANKFYLTGVQLEVGSVATPFEHRPRGTELSLCQRFFEYGGQWIDNNTVTFDTQWRVFYTYKVTKRTNTPVITRAEGSAPAGSPYVAGANEHWCIISSSLPAVAQEYGVNFTVDAEFY